MSDSELSDAPSSEIPPDSELEKCLRNETKKAAQLKDSEKFTVKNIRLATETTLGLPTDFFKEHETWKARSKEIIQHQVEQENAIGSPEASNQKAKRSKEDPSVKETKKPVKRPSVEDKRPAKKQKVESEDESALSSPPSDSDSEDKSRRSSKQKKTKDDAKSTEAENEKEESGSEMSVVLDAEPAKTTQRKSKSSSGSKPKAAAETDPDQEEIKKLQGWLVKCGVRKVWGKELKPYESSKAKIKHLKGMLTDVGMTGRFSNEKAAQIKEARELAADIEAVQEGNERWGKSGSDSDNDKESKTRGGRRLVRGAKNYDFLSSDGEETD